MLTERDLLVQRVAAASEPGTPSFAVAPMDEKQRIAAIINSPHAKGREALAQHLALSTNMPAAQAVEMLQAAPAAAPAAPRAIIPPVAQRSADAALAGALSIESAPGTPGAQRGDYTELWRKAVAKASAPVLAEKKALGIE